MKGEKSTRQVLPETSLDTSSASFLPIMKGTFGFQFRSIDRNVYFLKNAG